jgi:hypothetical protein
LTSKDTAPPRALDGGLVGRVGLHHAHLDVDREAARPLEPAAGAVVAAHAELRALLRAAA